jgi:hypothetical protein
MEDKPAARRGRVDIFGERAKADLTLGAQQAAWKWGQFRQLVS